MRRVTLDFRLGETNDESVNISCGERERERHRKSYRKRKKYIDAISLYSYIGDERHHRRRLSTFSLAAGRARTVVETCRVSSEKGPHVHRNPSVSQAVTRRNLWPVSGRGDNGFERRRQLAETWSSVARRSALTPDGRLLSRARCIRSVLGLPAHVAC